jgi:hypothetical protein
MEVVGAEAIAGFVGVLLGFWFLFRRFYGSWECLSGERAVVFRLRLHGFWDVGIGNKETELLDLELCLAIATGRKMGLMGLLFIVSASCTAIGYY